MAEKPLKSLKFHGLDDIYTIPTKNFISTEIANAKNELGLTIDTAKAEAIDSSKVYTNEQVKKASPLNLLDNSDFRNPVNQRGETSYTNVVYGIDRWKTNMGPNLSVNVGTDRITLSKANFAGDFSQTLPLDLIGKTVTAAMKTSYGIYCNSFVVSETDDFCQIGGLSAYLGVYSGNGNTIFRIYFNDSSAIEIDLFWSALYEGEYTVDTLPEYQPKGYENELLICRQYDPNTGDYIGLRKFGQPQNLLDNSDFTNVVNQRGTTSITPGTSATYFIDRWRVSRGTATITDDGIELAWDGTNGNNIYLAQKLSGKWTVGDKYTVAIKINGEIKSVIAPITSSTSLISIDGTTVKIALTSSDNQILQLAIYHYDTTSVIYAWAALYKGEYTAETLPEYQPKGYAAELLECQRYYQRFSSGAQTYFVFGLGYMQSATSCRFFLPLTVPMRAKPTINSPSGIYFNYGTSSTRISLSSFDVNNRLPNQVFISAVPASNVATGTSGEVMTTTGTNVVIELTADL